MKKRNTYLTSGLCPKCGKRLFTSDIRGYAFVCKSCDENFYTMEVKENLGDIYEITVEMSTTTFRSYFGYLKKISSKYDFIFMNRDGKNNVTTFGWAESFPGSEIVNAFVDEIESLN